jgi:hypothetical protein
MSEKSRKSIRKLLDTRKNSWPDETIIVPIPEPAIDNPVTSLRLAGIQSDSSDVQPSNA